MTIDKTENPDQKPCNSIPGYDVRRDGTVSLGRKTLHPTWVARRGYYVYPIDVMGKRKPKLVSALVADAFVPRPETEDRCYVQHLDGDLSNHRADNLKWQTATERRYGNSLARLLDDCPGLTREQFEQINGLTWDSTR